MAASAAASASAATTFSSPPSTMISRLAPYLGATVTSRDVRALACVSKQASVAVQRMPVLGIRVEAESKDDEMPDGSVCLTEKQAVKRVQAASRVVQTIGLTGNATHGCISQILRACHSLRTLSVESHAPIDWSQDEDPSPLSTSLISLHLRSCFSLFHLHLMLQKLPSLQCLSISNCPDLTQDDFEAMPATALAGLQALRLTNCAGVTDLAVAELSKRIGASLKAISFAGCSNITSAGVGYALERTPALVSLDLCNCSRIGSEVCDIISRAGIAGTLRLLRLPARVSDAEIVRLVTTAASGTSSHAAPDAASTATGADAATSGLVQLRHLGLTGTGVTDAALDVVVSHLPELLALDLQLCACLSFRVVDLLASKAAHLQRIDVRGQRRLRGDDIEKLIGGIPTLTLIVGEPVLIGDARLKAMAGARSVVLRSKPGLSTD